MLKRTQTPIIHLTDCVQLCREVESEWEEEGTINTEMNVITALIPDDITKKNPQTTYQNLEAKTKNQKGFLVTDWLAIGKIIYLSSK